MSTDTTPRIGPFAFPNELTAFASRDVRLARASLALRVLSTLADNAARTGTCYRSQKKLAFELHCDSSSLRRALQLLERLGYISRHLRPGRKVYDFTLPIDPNLRGKSTRPAVDGPSPANASNGHSDFGERLDCPRSSGGASHLPTSGGASHLPTSGGASTLTLRGAPQPPEHSERDLETEMGNHHPGPEMDDGTLSLQKSGEQQPETVHAWTRRFFEVGPKVIPEVASAIAELIASSSPDVVRRVLWKCVEGRSSAEEIKELHRRLLLGADHADAELASTGDRALAGLHWGSIIFKGHRPIRADSEAAGARTRRPPGPTGAPPAPGGSAKELMERRRARRAALGIVDPEDAPPDPKDPGSSPQDTRQIAQDGPRRDPGGQPGESIDPPRRSILAQGQDAEPPGLGDDHEEQTTAHNKFSFNPYKISDCQDIGISYNGVVSGLPRAYHKSSQAEELAKLAEFKRRRLAAASC